MKILVVDDAPEVVEAVTLSFNLQWRETDIRAHTMVSKHLSWRRWNAQIWCCWISQCRG